MIRLGNETLIHRHLYVHKPSGSLKKIEANLAKLEREIAQLLKGSMA